MKGFHLILLLFLPILLVGCGQSNLITNNSSTSTSPAINQSPTSTAPSLLALPLPKALERVTKKPFGIKISPQSSPVSPERFSGYHTGVDFEILPGEANTDMTVAVICKGKLLVKEYVSGYGGVAVQSCQIDNQAVTVIYGHLKLASITAKVGNELKAGDRLGVLGKGYSTETDGERQHLHLGIHQGSTVNIRGYVASQEELSAWLDPLLYLR